MPHVKKNAQSWINSRAKGAWLELPVKGGSEYSSSADTPSVEKRVGISTSADSAFIFLGERQMGMMDAMMASSAQKKILFVNLLLKTLIRT